MKTTDVAAMIEDAVWAALESDWQPEAIRKEVDQAIENFEA